MFSAKEATNNHETNDEIDANVDKLVEYVSDRIKEVSKTRRSLNWTELLYQINGSRTTKEKIGFVISETMINLMFEKCKSAGYEIQEPDFHNQNQSIYISWGRNASSRH